MEGALKSSFMSEAALKTTHQQAYGDDLWANGNGQNVVSGDDFFVDDLLDFSNGFVEEQGEEEKGEDNAVHKICSVSVSVSPQKQLEDKEAEKENDTVSPPAKEDFDSLPGSELIVPVSPFHASCVSVETFRFLNKKERFFKKFEVFFQLKCKERFFNRRMTWIALNGCLILLKTRFLNTHSLILPENYRSSRS